MNPEEQKAEVKSLRDKVVTLETENAALKEAGAKTSAQEILIRKKMRFGLTREQAIASLKHQIAFDEHRKRALDSRTFQGRTTTATPGNT
jgi:hypothetical protein